MRLFKNLKARILKSIITWSEMGKQTAQAKEVYTDNVTGFLHSTLLVKSFKFMQPIFKAAALLFLVIVRRLCY